MVLELCICQPQQSQIDLIYCCSPVEEGKRPNSSQSSQTCNDLVKPQIEYRDQSLSLRRREKIIPTFTE